MIGNRFYYGIFCAICGLIITLVLMYDVPKFSFSFYSSKLNYTDNSKSLTNNRTNTPFVSQKISKMFFVKNQSVSLSGANLTHSQREYPGNLTSKLNETLKNETQRKSTGYIADRMGIEKKVTTANTTDIFRKTHFMTISGNGRLGNQMFEFASLLGIADMNGYTPFVTSQHSLNKIFDIPQTSNVRMENSKGIGETFAGCYDKHLENLSHQFNWTLRGYYQSWRYFDRIKDKVKSSFRFKERFTQNANSYLSEINLSKRTSVGVHIRRRDMNSGYHLARGYSVATVEYIKRAVDYFKKNVVNPVFVVVSDDRDWAKRYLQDKDIIHTRRGSSGEDMALLANCNHSIISTGSYGWWGAWLAGGKVVYFRDFPTPGSFLDKRYNKSDYYPPHWIGMV
ncbi:hypothetical protein KUTeg_010989 [Tegillarca granosa]|uniref:L-Fucosyltransferase n=1 Tax=Tegillarca granosa TaxID=220873 RepID=A0ABQ9F2K0_TEGGR|nr:hypothetical protein KUTeg_010989 [Tegillarca granosa]